MSRPQTPGSAASAGQPRQMSSRLLTMKFMQRAAAGSPLSTASPSSKLSYAPGERSPKRQRLTESTPSSTPVSASGNATPILLPQSAFADRSAIDAALRAEAEARVIARARNARAGDETEWVLNLPPNQTNGHVYTNGQTKGHILGADNDDDGDIWNQSDILRGRQTYGNFTRRKPSQLSTGLQVDEDDLSSASENAEVDPTTPVRSIIRPDRDSANSRKRSRANSHDEEREGRRMDRLDLKGMSGISGSAVGKAVTNMMSKTREQPKPTARKKNKKKNKGKEKGKML